MRQDPSKATRQYEKCGLVQPTTPGRFSSQDCASRQHSARFQTATRPFQMAELDGQQKRVVQVQAKWPL
jgi:hypothetical protein